MLHDLLAPNILGFLVVPKRNKTTVPQVGILGPFDELKLPDEHGIEPATPAFSPLSVRRPIVRVFFSTGSCNPDPVNVQI